MLGKREKSRQESHQESSRDSLWDSRWNFGETLCETFRALQASPQSLGSDYMHGSPQDSLRNSCFYAGNGTLVGQHVTDYLSEPESHRRNKIQKSSGCISRWCRSGAARTKFTAGPVERYLARLLCALTCFDLLSHKTWDEAPIKTTVCI